MRIILGCLLICAGCKSHPPQPEYISVFEGNADALEAAAQAGRHCQARPRGTDHDYPPNECLGHDIPYDKQACVAFDDAIQIASRPLSYCSDADARGSDAELDMKCDEFLAAFLTPCVGIHAANMGRNDWARSNSYREAISRGMDKDRAAEVYLSDVVRYRQLPQ